MPLVLKPIFLQSVDQFLMNYLALKKMENMLVHDLSMTYMLNPVKIRQVADEICGDLPPSISPNDLKYFLEQFDIRIAQNG